MTPQEQLRMQVADLILSVANDFNDVTYSDLQGTAMVQADNIIKLVQEQSS